MSQYKITATDLQEIVTEVQLRKEQFSRMKSIMEEMLEIIQDYEKKEKQYKEVEKKYMEQLQAMRHLSIAQEQTIAKLSEFAEKHVILMKQNSELQTFIQNLVNKHEEASEKFKQQADKKVEELTNQMEAIQATTDFHRSEIQNEICHLTKTYEDQLQRARDKERHLESQLNLRNTQIDSNFAHYQKQIAELEEKNRHLEEEKARFILSKGGFLSGQDILNIQSKVSKSKPTVTATTTTTTSAMLAEKFKSKFSFAKHPVQHNIATNSTSNTNESPEISNANAENENNNNDANEKNICVKRRKIFNPNALNYLDLNNSN